MVGPCTIKSISKTGIYVLINEKGFVLKKKYNVSLLKPYNSKPDSGFPEEMKKLSKFFGSCSGGIECVSKAVGKNLWRSAWLLIAKQKHNWFVIGHAFWK